MNERIGALLSRKFLLAVYVISLLAMLLVFGNIGEGFLKEIVLLIVGFYFGVNTKEHKQKDNIKQNIKTF